MLARPLPDVPPSQLIVTDFVMKPEENATLSAQFISPPSPVLVSANEIVAQGFTREQVTLVSLPFDATHV
jgi:hypothetical protein